MKAEETQINIAALIENQRELPEEHEEHYQNARTKSSLIWRKSSPILLK